MNLEHVNAKIYVEGVLTVDLQRFIETFHRWVAEQSAAELLIDVADYRHVPDGPGVVLVGLEADYAIDHRGGQYGLLYNRKAPLEGDNTDRVVQALHSAAWAAARLEAEFQPLRFSRRRFELFVNDRALAPNDAATRAACEPIFAAAIQAIAPDADRKIEFDPEPRRRLTAVVTLSADADWAKLIAA